MRWFGSTVSRVLRRREKYLRHNDGSQRKDAVINSQPSSPLLGVGKWRNEPTDTPGTALPNDQVGSIPTMNEASQLYASQLYTPQLYTSNSSDHGSPAALVSPYGGTIESFSDNDKILPLFPVSAEASVGIKRSRSFTSLHSQTSRSSSPPRSASIGTNGGHITPDTIPFQAFQPADLSELYRLRNTPPQATVTALPVNKYRYTTIQPGEVRLMVLYSGRFDDAICCGLKVMPLHRLEGSQLVYQALSYAWGLDTDLMEIKVQDVYAMEEAADIAAWLYSSNPNARQRSFHVRRNLYDALRRLRSESEQLWFWIDAVCIDQDNLEEKGHQLPRMLEIYCNAWSVCIWLGEAESPGGPGPDAFDLIGTIINLKLLDYIVEAPLIDDQVMLSFISFAKLLKRPWFRRRWVIQEVSSSTRASVQYGNKKVNWIDFADAIQLFVLKLDRIRALHRGSRLFEGDPDAFSHVEAAGASAIVQATNDVVRKGEDGRIAGHLCDIETLVMRFVHFEASDPRDTIFALWSLANARTTAHDHVPGLLRDLKVSTSSYLQSCQSIYIDFVCHCIKLHGSLDILCRHWALPLDCRSTDARLPPLRSWIGTTPNSPFGMHLGSGGRMNGDSLVGSPGQKVYNASGNNLPIVNAKRTLTQNTILQVSGRLMSRVSQVSPRVVDGTVPYDAFRLLGWSDKTKVGSIPDSLWRTLVADRTIDGSKAPSWWRRACMFALSMASRDGDLSTQRLLQNKSVPQTVHEYLRRVQAVVWNRRMFGLESSGGSGINAIPLSGMVGLGPSDTRQGDCLCILMGCSVPVILREIPSAPLERVFELVGECYVHGIMDGEALEYISFTAPSAEMTFNLV